MRRTLMIVSLVFCLGFATAGRASGPTERGGQAARGGCAARCREEAREAERRCHLLPSRERRECERRVHERLEACLRNCR